MSGTGGDSPSAVVVGAGAFGAGAADALARRGWRVTVVEQDEPAGPRSTSGDATRLLRFGHGLFDPDGWYTASAWKARSLWKELEEDAGRSLLVESGVVWFVHGDGEDEAASEAMLRRQGIPVSRVAPADLAAVFPSIEAGDLSSALYEPAGGVLRVAEAVRALIARARRSGADLITARAHPAEDGSAVVEGRVLGADLTVWACGPWLARLFPHDVELTVTRQEVFYFDAGAAWTAAEVPAWIDSSGCEPYGHADVARSGVKMLSDRPGPPFDVESEERASDPDELELIRSALGWRFPDLAGAPLRSASVCQYELTADRHFLVSPFRDDRSVWILGGGSGHGAKHAPALGEHLADRLEGAADPHELSRTPR